jgi:glyoxylase-like metal-dependent hydrolase (beta-lactamase superfamily II)
VTASPVQFPFAVPPDPGQVIEAAPGVLWARLPLPGALDHVNVYALDDGDGWALVDTGMAGGKTEALWEALLAGPLGGRPVRRVIVTHHHPDHVGLAGWFQARGASLWMPRTGWLFARMLTLDVQDRPRPETLAFWRAAGMAAGELDRRAAERPFNFADAVAPMPLGFTRIDEGQVIRAGGRDWAVRFGQGHAPDQATFWSLSDGLILGGDQLLPGISPNLGVYATEPGADPVGDWLASCRTFAGLAREDHLVLPGHQRPFTGLPARLTALIDEALGALDRLEQALGRPMTAVDCFPTLYRRTLKPGEVGLALVEAVANLNHLERTGRAVRHRGTDGVDLWRRVESLRAG